MWEISKNPGTGWVCQVKAKPDFTLASLSGTNQVGLFFKDIKKTDNWRFTKYQILDDEGIEVHPFSQKLGSK